MNMARFIVGDTRDVTATIPDHSVDLILTSPPFLALRSYLPADHPDKSREVGSEPTPAAYIDMLLGLTADWARVLAAHGSICVELGDTYSGSGGAGGDYNDGRLRDGQQAWSGSASKRAANGLGDDYRPSRGGRDAMAWPLAKSKALIPELYRVALAYGINPLTGQESPAGRWKVRNVVTWCRPNPPVGALGDKYRPATSDLAIFTRASTRWFDLDAVRTTLTEPGRIFKNEGTARRAESRGGQRETNEHLIQNPAGAPPLDYWVITPKGYSGSHYAVYPPELCRIPIDSMCPRQVCTQCGQPRRRITGAAEYVRTRDGGPPNLSNGHHGPSLVNKKASGIGDNSVTRTALTVGWSDCGHNSWRPGVVFDPFAGSGTTLMVATGMGRDTIGIDIDPRNADLARARCGMFLTIEHHDRTPAA